MNNNNKITQYQQQHEEKKINLYTYPVQFSIEETDYSQTYLAQMYPPVEASSGHKQCYIRLT